MSAWTYITGVITVSPMGRTQAEKRYVLETVLSHLPNVTGAEKDMYIEILQCGGYNGSSNFDEFGLRTDNLKDWYGDRSAKDGYMRTQDDYLVVLYGNFRDRYFKQTFREFNNWICRLSKRVMVDKALVKLSDDIGKSCIFENTNDVYGSMFECPSWSRENGDAGYNWCEYLLWKPEDLRLMNRRMNI